MSDLVSTSRAWKVPAERVAGYFSPAGTQSCCRSSASSTVDAAAPGGRQKEPSEGLSPQERRKVFAKPAQDSLPAPSLLWDRKALLPELCIFERTPCVSPRVAGNLRH